MSTEFKSVEGYFKARPEKTRRVLKELRKCILKAAPHAIEVLNYNIPAFALAEGGKRDQQVMIAGYVNHVGFYPHPTVVEKFNKELDAYKKSKGSVQFSIDKPLPKEIIVRMIKYRMELLK